MKICLIFEYLHKDYLIKNGNKQKEKVCFVKLLSINLPKYSYCLKIYSFLPGFTVAAIASISLNVIPDDLTALSTTSSMCFLCKSCATGGIIPPLL